MKEFPIIYKRATTGAVQQWQIFVDGNQFFTRAGQCGGAITESARTTCEGKNIGRANETSPEEQALFEANSKHNKKLEKGYFLTLDAIDDTRKFFEPMLAKVYEKEKQKLNWDMGIVVQPKLDGIRAIITKDGATTRNGKEHKAIPHILKALEPLFRQDPDLILDGEIYNHTLHDDFNKISSVVRKQKPTAAELAESEKLAQFHCYDCPHIGKMDQDYPFATRYEAMAKLLERVWESCVQVVPNLLASNEQEVQECHDKFVEQGYEGAIVRERIAPYVNKRSDKLLKLKVFQDDEFTIENVDHGRGLKEDMAATVRCTSKSGEAFDATIKAPHDTLKSMWANKDKYVGKTCTVRYFGLTPDKAIPRFPYMIDIDRWIYE